MKSEKLYIEGRRKKDIELIKNFKKKCKDIEEPHIRVILSLIKKWLREDVKSE